MSGCFSFFGNFCTFLSCLGDATNAITKLFPCMRKRKEEPLPKFREATYKITFLDHTVIKFEKIEENISED